MKHIALFINLTFLLLTGALLGQEKTGDTPEVIRGREEWFYRQRAYPLRQTPPGARLRALRQMAAMEKQVHSEVLPFGLGPIPTNLDWRSIGPAPTVSNRGWGFTSGRITALAVDPTNRDIAYAGAAEGGVWKTTDGGQRWVPLSDFEDSMAIGSLAIDPSNTNIIYAGTGEANSNFDAYYGAGILKSTDAGNTWKVLNDFTDPLHPEIVSYIGAVAVHPANSQIVLAAVAMNDLSSARNGIYRSVDGGANWTNVLSGCCPTAVLFNPADGNLAYVAMGRSGGDVINGIYKSIDAGLHWTASNGSPCSTIFPLCSVIAPKKTSRITLAIAASHPATLYASIESSEVNAQGNAVGNLRGLYRSYDAAAHWQRVNVPDFCDHNCWYGMPIGIDPAKPGVIVVGGTSAVVRTLDGAQTWGNITSAGGVQVHPDMHAVAFAADGSRMYVGNDGGVWSSDDFDQPSMHWQDLNSTLSITQFYPGISIQASSSLLTFGGTQDNGVLRYTGSTTWEEVTCGDGGWSAIKPEDPTNRVYTSCTPSNVLVEASAHGGAAETWIHAWTNISSADRVSFIPPLVMDPTTPTTLYFGTYRVYRSLNEAHSWTAISDDLTGGYDKKTISTIAVAPSDSSTVYAGSDSNQMHVTRNALVAGMACWADISVGVPRAVTQVAVDPYKAEVAYVTYSGFAETGSTFTGHVYKTTNAGGTWNDISSNLPNIPVNDLVVDPDVLNTLYVATDIGVFATMDGGVSWAPMSRGLPHVVVVSLKLHEGMRVLRAATHGRGAWDFVTPAPPPTVALSTTDLHFQAVAHGGLFGPSQTVTLINTSTSRLKITSFAVHHDYGETNTCGGSLVGGTSCTITVTFHPTSPGQKNDTLFITDNAIDSPQKITLEGVANAHVTP